MGDGGDCFFCSTPSVTSSKCLEGSSWTSVKLLLAHLLQLTPELSCEPPPSFDDRRRVYHRILRWSRNGEGTFEEEDVRRRIRICGQCQGIAERVTELHNEIRKVVQGLREVIVNSKRRRNLEGMGGDYKNVRGDDEYSEVLSGFHQVVSTLENLTDIVVKVEDEVPSSSEYYNEDTNDDVFSSIDCYAQTTIVGSGESVQTKKNVRRRRMKLKASTKKMRLTTKVKAEIDIDDHKNVILPRSRRRMPHVMSEEREGGGRCSDNGHEGGGRIENDDTDEDWSPGVGGGASDSDSNGAKSNDDDPIRNRTKQPKSKSPKPKLNVCPLPLICDLCPEPLKFDARFKLTHHLVQVHNRTDLGFQCKVVSCSKVFSSKEELWRHKNVHLRRFVCTVCDRSFVSAWKLQRHSVTHSNPHRSLVCDQCQITFPHRLQVRQHIAKHHPEKSPQKHKCHLCPQEYALKTTLAIHLKSVHGEGDVAVFTCDICQRTFLQKHHWESHVATHQKEKNFTCESCGFATNTKDNLKRHQYYKHNPEKKFGCPHCEKRFKFKTRLVDHLVVHTKERLYQCDLCGKSYSTVSILRNHRKKLHER